MTVKVQVEYRHCSRCAVDDDKHDQWTGEWDTGETLVITDDVPDADEII